MGIWDEPYGWKRWERDWWWNFFLLHLLIWIQFCLFHTHFVSWFSDYFWITTSSYSLSHLKRGECNECDTLQPLQPHSLFSSLVYTYLHSYFLPLTTTAVHTFAITQYKKVQCTCGNQGLRFLINHLQEWLALSNTNDSCKQA